VQSAGTSAKQHARVHGAQRRERDDAVAVHPRRDGRKAKSAWDIATAIPTGIFARKSASRALSSALSEIVRSSGGIPVQVWLETSSTIAVSMKLEMPPMVGANLRIIHRLRGGSRGRRGKHPRGGWGGS